VKNKFKKIFLVVLFFYAQLVPSSGLIKEVKSIEELEEEKKKKIGVGK